jgi:hypothetical protein
MGRWLRVEREVVRKSKSGLGFEEGDQGMGWILLLQRFVLRWQILRALWKGNAWTLRLGQR